MKKKIVSLMIAIIGFISCNAFVACDSSSSSSSQTQPTEAVLNGFEHFEDFLEFDYDGKYGSTSNYFGDVRLNKDKEYITEGEASMYYEVSDRETYPDLYMTSTVLIPTSHQDKNYSDFRKVKSISIDVYNATETEVDLSICPANILGKTWALQQRYLMTFNNYVLPAKTWTTVHYAVDPASVDMILDVQKIGWIAFKFGGVNAAVYLDNLQVKMATEEYIPAEMVLDKNEVCSFDKEYQQIVAFAYGGSDVKLGMEINTDRNYSITGNSLKVTIPANERTSGYITFKLSDKLMKAVELGSYEKGAKFAFDVRKMYDAEQWILPTFRNSYWGTRTEVPHANIPVGQEWWTFEVEISSLCSSPDIFELSFPVAGRTDRVLYFDNFRIIP